MKENQRNKESLASKKERETKARNQEIHPLEQEILNATGQESRRRTENEKGYFDRLRKAISELDDEEWNRLSGSAQAWYNESSEVV